ncbi:phage baseplate protein [Rubrivirga sp.]|uniref:T4 family baseplate hub assembly chaperone n=1 Tax=Rubrivirga sp. TaxID=1885344 RepID=UPI003B52594B
MPPTASQFLDVCERGRGRPPVERALLLLGAAHPETSPDALAALPIGRRDARLLDLRERTLGPTLELETRCPACDERLDLDLGVADLLASAPDNHAPAPLEVDHGGVRATVRLPTSADLAAAETPDALLARCVVGAHYADGAPVEALPDAVAEAAAQAMAEADPLADVELALSCPACDHGWLEPLDVAGFVWAEVEAWAPRVLHDVHRLASAYGWAERDVLAMSAWRRDQYLRLLGS